MSTNRSRTSQRTRRNWWTWTWLTRPLRLWRIRRISPAWAGTSGCRRCLRLMPDPELKPWGGNIKILLIVHIEARRRVPSYVFQKYIRRVVIPLRSKLSWIGSSISKKVTRCSKLCYSIHYYYCFSRAEVPAPTHSLNTKPFWGNAADIRQWIFVEQPYLVFKCRKSMGTTETNIVSWRMYVASGLTQDAAGELPRVEDACVYHWKMAMRNTIDLAIDALGEFWK